MYNAAYRMRTADPDNPYPIVKRPSLFAIILRRLRSWRGNGCGRKCQCAVPVPAPIGVENLVDADLLRMCQKPKMVNGYFAGGNFAVRHKARRAVTTAFATSCDDLQRMFPHSKFEVLPPEVGTEKGKPR